LETVSGAVVVFCLCDIICILPHLPLVIRNGNC